MDDEVPLVSEKVPSAKHIIRDGTKSNAGA